VIVGWAGSNTHLDDIRELRGWIERPITEHKAKLRIMGAVGYREQFPALQEVETIPWLPIETYRQKLAELDIGLAPLAESEFNRCKSWLRPLELAACGVPVVASDYGEYSRLLRDSGAGLLVRKKRDWERHIDYLLRDPSVRREMSKAGRELAKKHDVSVGIYKWKTAIEII
jgi:glycosyltransferase involved in cell wall biosynthesis